MTVIEATMKLVDWFQKNHTFSLNKNFKDIIVISEDEDADLAAILSGLKKLERLNMLSQERINGNDIFVLEKPMESVDQTITITAPVSKRIAEIINEVVKDEDANEDFCDFTNLKERDIKNLIFIIDNLSRK